MTIEKVLILDEKSSPHIVLHEVLRKKKISPTLVHSKQEALERLQQHRFDLFIYHTRKEGLELLKQLKQQNLLTPVVLISENPSIEETVEAMQLGAYHCLQMPLSLGPLMTLLNRLEEQINGQLTDSYLEEEISTQSERKKHLLIVESDMMKQILSDVSKIAKSSSSVFISGESGTGKEVIAAAIHSQSHRHAQAFIKVNCAAIPATLLESEFFGHEKGAFTGALQRKLGRFELAHKGTLLLDEVSEIPLELQSKLLRAVQEMEFERVGGVQSICVDTRLISTSNRSMKEAIEQKLFREDLYYRLNVVPIHLPPLRERREDILPLAEFFLKRLCEENQKPLKRLCVDAKRKLRDYSWPGNIRELANVIERTVIMNPTESLEAHQVYLDLSCPVKESPSAILPVGITIAELEKRLILETLSQEKGNRTKAAAILGISLRTLRNKINCYSRDSQIKKD